MSNTPCNHRWMAPRHDVPTSVDVEHVCGLPMEEHAYGLAPAPAGATGLSMHAVPIHRCSCGATHHPGLPGIAPPPPPPPPAPCPVTLGACTDPACAWDLGCVRLRAEPR
jgi:hypothetical protein